MTNSSRPASASPSSRGGRFIPGPLEERHLRQLLQHEYSVSGQSLVEPLMQRLWNALIGWVPLWAAPNALTLTGLAMNASSAALMVAYSPDGRQDLPAWLLLYAAFALFVYQTLDALDGKQARRTGTSSQLGELFDHGCDAANTLLVTLSLSTAIGLGHSPALMMLQCCSSMTLFFVAHWIAYITGRIQFGRIDVTEAQLSVMAMYVVSACAGVNGAWGLELLPATGLRMRHLQVAIFLSTSSPMYFRLLGCIASGGAGKNGSTVANTSIIFPGLVWTLLLVLAAAVVGKSPALMLDRPCLFLIAFGASGVKTCERLIVAHMTRTELALWDTGLLGPGLLVVNQYFNHPLPEGLALWIAAGVGIADVLQYSWRLCLQIAAYLGIRVLTIGDGRPSSGGGGGGGPVLRPRRSQ